MNRGPQDRSHVNTSEDYEVRYWSEKWGVSPERLKVAVLKLDATANEVAKGLGIVRPDR